MTLNGQNKQTGESWGEEKRRSIAQEKKTIAEWSVGASSTRGEPTDDQVLILDSHCRVIRPTEQYLNTLVDACPFTVLCGTLSYLTVCRLSRWLVQCTKDYSCNTQELLTLLVVAYSSTIYERLTSYMLTLPRDVCRVEIRKKRWRVLSLMCTFKTLRLWLTAVSSKLEDKEQNEGRIKHYW